MRNIQPGKSNVTLDENRTSIATNIKDAKQKTVKPSKMKANGEDLNESSKINQRKGNDELLAFVRRNE